MFFRARTCRRATQAFHGCTTNTTRPPRPYARENNRPNLPRTSEAPSRVARDLRLVFSSVRLLSLVALRFAKLLIKHHHKIIFQSATCQSLDLQSAKFVGNASAVRIAVVHNKRRDEAALSSVKVRKTLHRPTPFASHDSRLIHERVFGKQRNEYFAALNHESDFRFPVFAGLYSHFRRRVLVKPDREAPL